jgi:hypothetical protein
MAHGRANSSRQEQTLSLGRPMNGSRAPEARRDRGQRAIRSINAAKPSKPFSGRAQGIHMHSHGVLNEGKSAQIKTKSALSNITWPSGPRKARFTASALDSIALFN